MERIIMWTFTLPGHHGIYVVNPHPGSYTRSTVVRLKKFRKPARPLDPHLSPWRKEKITCAPIRGGGPCSAQWPCLSQGSISSWQPLHSVKMKMGGACQDFLLVLQTLSGLQGGSVGAIAILAKPPRRKYQVIIS